MRRVLLAAALCALLAAPAATGAHPSDSLFDADHDGIQNGVDNCPDNANPTQLDTDGDRAGDACDSDDDGDGAADALDNCALRANPAQADADADGHGDACDGDVDGDRFANGADNCPLAANRTQADADADGIGDACDSSRRRLGGVDTTGGLAGAGGDGGEGTGDRMPPRASVGAGGTHDVGALAYGLPVRARCRESCTIGARLELGGRDARRLGLAHEGAVVGSGAAWLGGAGQTFVLVRLNRAVLSRMRQPRRTRLGLRVTVADAADNRIMIYRRLSLRSNE